VEFRQLFDKIVFDWILDGVFFNQLRIKLAKNFQLLSDNPLFLKFFSFSGSQSLLRFGASLLLLDF